MKKNKVLLFVSYATIIGGLMSCANDGPESMSASDAKSAFSAVNTNLSASLDELADNTGFEALNSFTGITNSTSPFGKIAPDKPKDVRKQIKMTLAAIRSRLVSSASTARIAGDEPFDYNAKKGIYTYNFQTESFSRTGDSDIIKILFPTEGSTTNNAEFRLSAYQEVATPNGDELYSPTLVDATVLVDGVVQAEVDLTAQYGADGQAVYANFSVSLTPYTFNLTLDDRNSSTSSVSESLSKAGKILIGFELKATYNSSLKSDENISKVNGNVQLMNIKFVFSVEAEDLQNADDISDIIQIGIKIDGKSAGKIVFEMDDTTGEPVPFVQYKDGSKELLSSVFEDLIVQLNGMPI